MGHPSIILIVITTLYHPVAISINVFIIVGTIIIVIVMDMVVVRCCACGSCG